MPKSSNVGDNPNDRMPPGQPLGHDEVAGDETNAPTGRVGAEASDEDQEEDTGRENQAGSQTVNRRKFDGHE